MSAETRCNIDSNNMYELHFSPEFEFSENVACVSLGNALMKCGETEKQIGGAEREFIQSSAINFLTPFRNFLEGDFKTIMVSFWFELRRKLCVVSSAPYTVLYTDSTCTICFIKFVLEI